MIDALKYVTTLADLKYRIEPSAVIVLPTTDDPREVERCHAIGCSSYLVKPVNYDKFAEAITNLGLYISLVQVPEIVPG